MFCNARALLSLFAPQVSELYSRYLDRYSEEMLDGNYRELWQEILSRHLNGTSLVRIVTFVRFNEY